ncbi:MAG: aminotransferase DegT [Micavibrio sp.]|nr:aminotransferase DegT [Micavibrio sp.]
MSNVSQIVEAVKTVLGDKDDFIALHEPLFQGRENEYLKDCIDTGWVSSVGAYVDRFSDDLAKRCGVKYAIPTVNGTAALHIALMLAGVKRDEEVLCPALTFIATANAISYIGAIPHFIDSEEQSLGVDVPKLDSYLSAIIDVKDDGSYNKLTGRRIAALVPMHTLGHPVDMNGLEALAQKYDLPIIADCAESLGSLYHDKPVEAFGLISTLSFNGNKIMTTGGGGAILTNDAELAKRAKHLTTTAKQPHPWEFIHDEIGYNYRMPNINAALGCAQLEQLDAFLKAKRDLAERYKLAFEGLNGVEFVREPEGTRSNYWLCAIRIEDGLDRDQILKALNDAGYMSRPLWKLMHELDMYKSCPHMDLSCAEKLERTVISIPSSVKLGGALK